MLMIVSDNIVQLAVVIAVALPLFSVMPNHSIFSDFSPTTGMVTMIIVLNAVNLPVEDISLLLAVDWFLDRFRTAANVSGDTIGAAIVQKLCQRHLPPQLPMHAKSTATSLSQSPSDANSVSIHNNDPSGGGGGGGGGSVVVDEGLGSEEFTTRDDSVFDGPVRSTKF